VNTDRFIIFVLVAWFSSSAVLGWAIGDYFTPADEASKDHIDMASSAVKKSVAERGSDSTNKNTMIEYLTTGSILTEFYLKDGYCIITPCVIDHDLIFLSNGSTGEVELYIPSSITDRFASQSPIWSKGWIGNVEGASGNLSFERISTNDEYSVIRIKIPAGENQITISGTVDPGTKKQEYMVEAGVFVWMALILPVILILSRSNRKQRLLPS